MVGRHWRDYECCVGVLLFASVLYAFMYEGPAGALSRGLMFVLVVAVFATLLFGIFPAPGMNWPVRPRLAMSQRLLPEDKGTCQQNK
ncbi:MAG: hypothetical protein M9930_03755 [Anaerolineae bacterium]|nr:hypothetical protein [Anaerolineae bacterium]